MILAKERFPFTTLLEERWLDIRRETDRLSESHFFPWYEPGAYAGQWQLCGLYAGSHPEGHRVSEEVVALCPETVALLRAIPGIQIASFSALGPHTTVYPHRDVGLTGYRCHLGLRVPPGCYLQVGDQIHSWTEGRCLVFDGTELHAAANQSSERRIVLLVEVAREVYPA